MRGEVNPRRHLAIGAVVVLLLAGLAWWLFRTDARGPRDSNAESVAQAGQSPAGAVIRATGLREANGLTLGSIAGKVRDEENNGIPNAQVCVRGTSDEMTYTAFRFPKCTTTDSSGNYRVGGLLPARYGVGAQAPRFLPSSHRETTERGQRERLVAVPEAAQVTGVDFVLRPGGICLSGRVMDVGGGTIEGAWVTTQNSVWTATGADGRYELWTTPGQKTLAAQAPGYASSHDFVFPPTELADLYLVPESTITGHVVLADTQKPVAGMGIYRTGYEGWPPFAVTDIDGRFLVDGLEPGRYELEARSDEFYGRTNADVATTLGEAREGVVIEVSAAVAVEGQILIAGSKEPCAEGSVKLHPTAGGEVLADNIDVNDAGLVTISGVVPGTYRVLVACEGYLADDVEDLQVSDEGAPPSQAWEVRPGLAISGRVTTASGDAVPDARVRAQPGPTATEAPAADATTGDDGSFSIYGLDAVHYDVFVAQSTAAPTPSKPEPVDLSSAMDANGVELVLEASATLEGRVTDTKGRAVVGARVEPAAPRGMDFAWGLRQQDRTDAEGKYRIEGLAGGDYRVRVGRAMSEDFRIPGQGPEDPSGVAVTLAADDTTHLDIEVVANDLEINGVVTSIDGPVADAFVHFARMSDSAASNGQLDRWATRWRQLGAKPILTDVDGRFVIRGLQEGRYVIRVHRRGGGEAFAEGVEAGSEVDLEIEETGSVEGRVVFEDGEPPAVLELSMVDDSASREIRHQTYRTNGQFRFERVPAGRYNLIVESSEGTALEKLELKHGEEKKGVRVELRSTHTVTGKLVDAETKEGIAGQVAYAKMFGDRNYNIENEPASHRISGNDGSFELRGVPSGTINLLVIPRHFDGALPEYGLVSIVRTIKPKPKQQDLGELPLLGRRVFGDDKPGDLGFKLREWQPHETPEEERFEVATVRPEGPAARAGMQVGDVITSVDGHDLSKGDPNGWYNMLMPVKVGTTVKIGVSRGVVLEMTAEEPPS